MLSTVLAFQTDEKTKQLAKKKSVKLGISLSQYVRSLVEKDLNISQKESNPWLDLAKNVQSVLPEEEIEQLFKEMKKSRANRSQKSWENIDKLVK